MMYTQSVRSFSILLNCCFLDSCSCVPDITAFNMMQIHAHDNLFDTSRHSLQVDGVHDRPVTSAPGQGRLPVGFFAISGVILSAPGPQNFTARIKVLLPNSLD